MCVQPYNGGPVIMGCVTGIQRLVHTSEIDAGTEQDVMGLFITVLYSLLYVYAGFGPSKKRRDFFRFFCTTKKGSRSTFNLVLQ